MNLGILRKRVYILVFIFLFFVVLFSVNVFNSENSSGVNYTKNASKFDEDFNAGFLNSQKWEITSEGDFKESIIEVYDIDPSENADFRLRLGLNTIGTNDRTVKSQGVKSVNKVNFSDGNKISFDLDWNNQSNGCYLTGSLYLCPTATNGNPENENDWIKFEYIGVPPGQNARCVIANKVDGDSKLLYADGWPEERTGRKITDQHITIILDNKRFKTLENGKELYASPSYNLNFTSAYIYIQMSSHSNYPMREIYFDNIAVTKRA